MEDDDEQTMQMAADIARSRRSVELRRRQIKVSTTDGSTQTNDNQEDSTDSSKVHVTCNDFSTVQRQTTLLCYMCFVLVISNLSQLRLTISLYNHRHFHVILGLLLCSLTLQCVIAVYLAYFTKTDFETEGNSAMMCDSNRYRSILVILLSIITLINVCVFVLS